MAFSSDGTMLAVGIAGEAVQLWDVTSETLQHTLAISGVNGLAFSPTDDILISGGDDYPAQLWNPKTGVSVGELEGFGDGVWDMVVSPDGSIFTIHKKGTFALTGETSDGIRVWDVSMGQVTRTIGPITPAYRLALSANGRILASVEHEGVFNTGENPVRIWNVTTEEQIQILGPYSLDLTDLALSPNGQLATVAWKVHDVQTGKVRYELTPDLRSIRHSIFSPDGQFLAYTLDNGTAKLVEAETGELLYSLSAPARYFDNGLAFSPDSKILAVGYQDDLIYLWDTETGANLQILTVDGTQVTSLAFAPDDRLLASGSKNSHTIQLWDSRTGQLLQTITTPEASIIHFTLDGRLLVLRRLKDGVVQLWGAPPE
ncbi:MAG: WD40 repeat domain-containing protein [Anaerolineae bacterium]|nr:WD40 repeat domain-containing protein [Anaerolineae bacterium]